MSADLRATRRYVRRHPNLTRGAALLFEEICDLHAERMGCIAGDPWLARKLNATERTIRNWRGELRKLGVLEESRHDGHRRLIPTPSDELSEQTEEESGSKFPENRKEISGKPENSFRKNASNRKEISGKPENSFRKNASGTEHIYNSSLRSESTQESARARARADPDGEIDFETTTADAIYRQITGHDNPGVMAVDLMRQTVDDGRSRDGPLPGSPEERRQFWEMICRTWTDSDTRNERQPKKLLDDFTDQLTSSSTRNGSEDIPDDPVENRKRILRAAARGAGLA